MGRRGGPGPRAISGGCGHVTDYFLGPGMPVGWVYVSRAIVNLHNSTLLQVCVVMFVLPLLDSYGSKLSEFFLLEYAASLMGDKR